MHSLARDKRPIDLTKLGVSALAGDIVVFSYGEIDVRCHLGRIRDSHLKKIDSKKNKSEPCDGAEAGIKISKQLVDELVKDYVAKLLQMTKAAFEKELQALRKKLGLKSDRAHEAWPGSVLEGEHVLRSVYGVGQGLKLVIMPAPPPSDRKPNPAAPFYGELKDRAWLTQLLNEALELACSKYEVIFLKGAYDAFTLLQDGSKTLNHEFSDGHVHVLSKHARIIQALLVRKLTATSRNTVIEK